MNKEIYEKNMEALKKKFPIWAYEIEHAERKTDFDVIAEQSLMDDTILKVRQNGRTLYLNGKYAPAAAAERWLQKQGKIEEYAPIVIVGISNGEHIRQIMAAVPKTSNILIYEPSFELFRRAVEEVDLEFLFQLDIPVGIIVDGLNDDERENYFILFISYDNMTSVKYYISGNYTELFQEKVEDFVKHLRNYIKDRAVQWYTLVRYADTKAGNTFTNLHYLYEGYNVMDLQGILPKDVPVIVVAAGPSLNKNIMELKNAMGKACIIATDTAMKPLLNAGIIPDLFVIIDGLKPGDLFVHKDISKVPMITMTGVSIEPMRIHKGKKFFYFSDSGFEQQILTDLGKKENKTRTLPNITFGGSVATVAYYLGIYMGADVVILVGQDLALTNNRTHADGTFQEKMEEVHFEADGQVYLEVDSVDGGKVLTRNDFKLYLDWYEEHIKEWTRIITIDATEGGALIHGSKVMTLKEAIKKHCIKEYNVKWHIDRIKKLFVGENRKIALKYFLEAEKKFNIVEKKAKDGLRYYEKLEKSLYRGKDINSKEIRNLLKKVQKINKYMENDLIARTALYSLAGLDFTLRPLVYRVQEDAKSELIDVAKHGEVMLYGVAVAAKEIASLAHDTVVPYAEKQMAEIEKGK